MEWLIREPIDVSLIRENVFDLECGAVVVFEGRVRQHTREKKIKALLYEAYPTLALKVFEQIKNEAMERWELGSVDIVHRVGWLQVEEVAVVVQVASAHRAEAFEACAYLIEELKKRAPIWKKEIYEDGTEQWVGEFREASEISRDRGAAGGGM